MHIHTLSLHFIFFYYWRRFLSQPLEQLILFLCCAVCLLHTEISHTHFWKELCREMCFCIFFLFYNIASPKDQHRRRQQQCPCPGLLQHAINFSRSKPPAVGLSMHTYTHTLHFPLHSLTAVITFPLCVASQASNDRC